MGLLRLAALGTLGYVGYKYYEKNKSGGSAAYAGNQGGKDIRSSGASAMRDKPAGWSATDEELDETFPASDPPANY